jgi:hypothetical protein
MTTATESDPARRAVAILHRHWLAADSVSYHLRRSMRSAEVDRDAPPGPLAAMSVMVSMLSVMGAWYGLLYVVVEGYRDAKLQDDAIDRLLAQGDFVALLRRFRNATFHVQDEPLPRKLLDFMTAPDSEVWINALNSAFRRFFERRLDIATLVADMTGGAGGRPAA